MLLVMLLCVTYVRKNQLATDNHIHATVTIPLLVFGVGVKMSVKTTIGISRK
jgi:hypothetical protein